MRRWIIALAIVIGGIALLIAFNHYKAERQQERPAKDKLAPAAPEQSGRDAQAASAAPSRDQSLAGIDLKRKRRILNAAIGCAKADYFRKMAALQAGPTGSDPLARLSAVQRLNFDKADQQCQTDPAARTAPVEEFLADLARNGNVAAGACYIAGGMSTNQQGIAPRDDASYRQLVPRLIERGLAAGDWSTVSLAASIEAPRPSGSPYTHLPPPKPELNYLYTKLLELGATADEKADLQSILADKSKTLSPAQRKSAEVRAEQLYQAHFARSPPYSHGAHPLCEGF
jgi:hypothetical protein